MSATSRFSNQSMAELKDETLNEELKIFMNDLVVILDNHSFRRLSLSENDLLSTPQRDFSVKFKEYENQITKLSVDIEEKTQKVSYLERRCENYQSENSKLRDEIARLTVYMSDSKDEYSQHIRDREQHLKSVFDSERSDFENMITNLRSQNAELKESIIDLKMQLHHAEVKIKEQLVAITKISESHVPKTQFDKILSEKVELDKIVLQQENTLLTEASQMDAYKQQIQKQRADFEILNQEYNLRVAELEEMRSQLRKQEQVARETLERSESRIHPEQMSFSYKFPQIEESNLNALAFNQGYGADMNHELMIKLETLQNKFEEHRLQSQKETEELKRHNAELQQELLKTRSHAQLVANDHQLSQRSVRDISTKDFSIIKKTTDISDELVEKIVRMEQQNKKLKIDVKVLNQMLSRNCEVNYQQMSTLFNAFMAYANQTNSFHS